MFLLTAGDNLLFEGLAFSLLLVCSLLLLFCSELLLQETPAET